MKIAKGTGNSVQVGSSDYPLDVFRAHYGTDSFKLIPINSNVLAGGNSLKIKYADVVDGDGDPVGDADAVRAHIQASIYSSTPAPVEPAG